MYYLLDLKTGYVFYYSNNRDLVYNMYFLQFRDYFECGLYNSLHDLAVIFIGDKYVLYK